LFILHSALKCTFFCKQSYQQVKTIIQCYKLGLLETDDLEEIISVQTERIMLQSITLDTPIFNNFLGKLPFGHYRSLKYRTAWGKDSFLKNPI